VVLIIPVLLISILDDDKLEDVIVHPPIFPYDADIPPCK
jgi:hypothetical protein